MVYFADLPVSWFEDDGEFVSAFTSPSQGDTAPMITFRRQSPMCSHGIQYLDKPYAHVLQGESGALLSANEDWSQVTLHCDAPAKRWHTAELAALCARFSAFDTFLVHGSFVISSGGDGIVFTGPSGVGKTTQALLWEKYAGAEIINGDKVFLRILENGSTYVFGLPWTGSSPYGLNRKAPLKAIVVLRQGTKNSLRQLDTDETTQLFLPHIFLPHWDNRAVMAALDTFEKVCTSVPILLLECLPNQEAVSLVEEML